MSQRWVLSTFRRATPSVVMATVLMLSGRPLPVEAASPVFCFVNVSFSPGYRGNYGGHYDLQCPDPLPAGLRVKLVLTYGSGSPWVLVSGPAAGAFGPWFVDCNGIATLTLTESVGGVTASLEQSWVVNDPFREPCKPPRPKATPKPTAKPAQPTPRPTPRATPRPTPRSASTAPPEAATPTASRSAAPATGQPAPTSDRPEKTGPPSAALLGPSPAASRAAEPTASLSRSDQQSGDYAAQIVLGGLLTSALIAGWLILGRRASGPEFAWSCQQCRSVNLPRSSRCYSCHAEVSTEQPV